MSRTLAFPVPAGLIESLEHVLSERRKADPTTPARDAFLVTLIEDAVAAGLLKIKEGARKRITAP